jgi:hypothetical protein
MFRRCTPNLLYFSLSLLAPDFYEYAAMHKFLASLQAAFFAADRDRSGTIDAREIHNALAAAGFQVPYQAWVEWCVCVTVLLGIVLIPSLFFDVFRFPCLSYRPS